jgi:hypothetical protein
MLAVRSEVKASTPLPRSTGATALTPVQVPVPVLLLNGSTMEPWYYFKSFSRAPVLCLDQRSTSRAPVQCPVVLWNRMLA